MCLITCTCTSTWAHAVSLDMVVYGMCVSVWQCMAMYGSGAQIHLDHTNCFAFAWKFAG